MLAISLLLQRIDSALRRALQVGSPSFLQGYVAQDQFADVADRMFPACLLGPTKNRA